MAKKQLGIRAITNRLQKKLDSHFTPEEQDFIEFGNDSENEHFYTWDIWYKGEHRHYTCDKNTGSVYVEILKR